MKKFENIEDFENVLKDSLSNHSVPAPDVWSAVSSSVTGGSTSLLSQVSTYFSSISNVLKLALFAGWDICSWSCSLQ